MINKTPLGRSQNTYIYDGTYLLIDRTMEEWLLDPFFALWDSWFPYRQNMGEFLVVVCACLSLKERIQTEEAKRICDVVQRFHKSLESCDMTAWSDDERAFVQELLKHPLFFGVSDKEAISLPRTAEFLDVPVTEEQIEMIQCFLEEQSSEFVQKEPKSELELLIATEFMCAPNRYESLLLALLSQYPNACVPSFLSDIHQVQAFVSAWTWMQREKETVFRLHERSGRFLRTSQWSYGDTRELFVLVAISHNEQEADFSWGNRHIWVFEDLLSALKYLWDVQPQRSKLIHSPCTYPNAVECSAICLDDGMCIDESSILGYESKERVFLEGDFWSVGGVLEKSRTEEEEQRQQQANAELARFLLDAESDSTVD